MFKEKRLMWLYGLTSAHVGSGDNLSYIDMPIQREIHTNFPKIEASSLKGSLRNAMRSNGTEEKVNAILGSWDNGNVASAVAISDAKILFFPVKSAKGVFAWVTCPMTMRRFMQDCGMLDDCEFGKNLESLDLSDAALTCGSCTLVLNQKKIMLEEAVFESRVDAEFEKWIESSIKYFPTDEIMIKEEAFKKRVVMVSDDDFEYFVSQSTEVVTRIRINPETKIIEPGALFTEEYLPPESILYSLLFITDEKKKEGGLTAKEIEKNMGRMIKNNLLQIGGNATLGKGLFKINWEGKKND